MKTSPPFVVSIDTESDCDLHWQPAVPFSFRAVREGVPRLMKCLGEFGAKATFLLSPEVIADNSSMELFQSLCDCELGTHLHGEFLDDEGNVRMPGVRPVVRAMQSSYPEDVERNKMVALTRLFHEKTGGKPKSFRAGRYAATARTFTILDELGYSTDSSVTPGLRWCNPEGTVDHRSAPSVPYLLGRNLLEIPLSIERGWAYSRAGSRVSRILRSVRKRPLWLRPSISSFGEMKTVMRTAFGRSDGGRALVYNMMFHVQELVPGLSPYTKTPADAEAFFKRLSAILQHGCQEAVTFATLDEASGIVRSRLLNRQPHA